MKQLITNFIADEQGQDIIEYALLGTFVSIAAYSGAQILASGYNTWFGELGASVGAAGTGLPF
jgi:Flp pilus assembly pilin Flp